mgnify:CR=1 FL=1
MLERGGDPASRRPVPVEQTEAVLASKDPITLKPEYAKRYHMESGPEAGLVFTVFNMDDPDIGYHEDPEREARNREEFLTVAQQILGFPIDVIAGREEARLIYQGVAHLLPQSDERRLVLDIGGRSTELIIGSGYAPQVMESYRVGSVAWSMRYFPDNVLSARNFERAEIAAKAVLDDSFEDL